MGRKRNTFSKAVKHLKSSRIDEKLQTLNEIPTMNTSGLYDVVPGALSRTEVDKDNPTIPDYTGIDWDVDGEDGRDTSGLFDAEGNSLFVTPPGDNSYILGPMASMFYNYSYYDWTMIGYIRESDRRFVNLGYLYENKTAGSEFSGRLEDWDGVNNFNSYGQLTLEQVSWFKDTPKKGGTGSSGHESSDFRAFYPGPPSSTPDAFGRYYCTITGTPKATTPNTKTVAPMDMQGSDNFSAIAALNKQFNKNVRAVYKGGKLVYDRYPTIDPEGAAYLRKKAKEHGLSAERAEELLADDPGELLKFVQMQDSLQADIDKYSQQQKDYEREARNIAIGFGVDVALTLAGGWILKGIGKGLGFAYKGVKTLNKANQINKAAKIIKAADKIDDAAAVAKATQAYNKLNKVQKSAQVANKAQKAAKVKQVNDANIFSRGRIDRSTPWIERGASKAKSQKTVGQLFKDNIKGVDRQRTSAAANAAWNPARGMPGYGSAKSVVNPRISAINKARIAKGKTRLTADQINPGGFQTGPDEASRRLIRTIGKAFTTVKNNPVRTGVYGSLGVGAVKSGIDTQKAFNKLMNDGGKDGLSTIGKIDSMISPNKNVDISELETSVKSIEKELGKQAGDDVRQIVTTTPKEIQSNLSKIKNLDPKRSDFPDTKSYNEALKLANIISGKYSPSGIKVAGKVYLNYIAGTLPKVIDNNYLGEPYVNRLWTDMDLTADGKVTSGDAVVGSGQKPFVDGDELVAGFNYDFNTNQEEIASDPQKFIDAGPLRMFVGLAAGLGNPYALDSHPLPPAGILTWASKKAGIGGDHRPGEIRIKISDLKLRNPKFYKTLVDNGTIKESSKQNTSSKWMPNKDVKVADNTSTQLSNTPGDGVSIKGKIGIGGNKEKSFGVKYGDTDIYNWDNNKKPGEIPSETDQDSKIKTNLDKELKKFDISKKGKKKSKNKSKSQVAHYEPQGELIKDSYTFCANINLSEDRKSNILKSLKDPVVLPESKKKHKVKPGQRYKGNTNFQGMDKLMGDVKPQEPFKKERNAWSKDWQGYNARLSQEKKNAVLELVGDGKQAFNYMLNDSRIKNAEEMEKFWGLHPELYSYVFNGKKYKEIRKEQVKGDYLVFLTDENGEKTTMLQSDISIKLAEEHEKEMLTEYNKTGEPTPFLKDPLMKRVAKRLKNEIDYPDKPAKKGYPNEPPPKQVDGWHPDYGKTYKYDKLDPVSAVMMKKAPTGNPEIDANVKKASMKPKVKVAEEIHSNWRTELKESDWTPVSSGRPTMSTSQTFQHASGATATFNALSGPDAHSNTVNITASGETFPVDAPTINEIPLQGHASPIDPWKMARKKNVKSAKQINAQLNASEKVAKKARADSLMKARVSEEDRKVIEKIEGIKKNQKILMSKLGLGSLTDSLKYEVKHVPLNPKLGQYKSPHLGGGMLWNSGHSIEPVGNPNIFDHAVLQTPSMFKKSQEAGQSRFKGKGDFGIESLGDTEEFVDPRDGKRYVFITKLRITKNTFFGYGIDPNKSYNKTSGGFQATDGYHKGNSMRNTYTFDLNTTADKFNKQINLPAQRHGSYVPEKGEKLIPDELSLSTSLKVDIGYGISNTPGSGPYVPPSSQPSIGSGPSGVNQGFPDPTKEPKPDEIVGDIVQVPSDPSGKGYGGQDMLDIVATNLGVGSAKDIFDYHRNWLKTKTSEPQDLTSLLNKKDYKTLVNYMSKLKMGPLDDNKSTIAALQKLIKSPGNGGLRNSLGLLDVERGDGIHDMGTHYEIRKAYDFSPFLVDTFGAIEDPSNLKSWVGALGAAGYALTTMGWYSLIGTPRMNMVFKIPKPGQKVSDDKKKTIPSKTKRQSLSLDEPIVIDKKKKKKVQTNKK